MKKMFIICLMVVSLVFAGTAFANPSNGQGQHNGTNGNPGNHYGWDNERPNGPNGPNHPNVPSYDGVGIVAAISISAGEAHVGNFSNGAIGAGGAGALTIGIGDVSMEGIAYTENFNYALTNTGREDGMFTDIGGKQTFKESLGYNESLAYADVQYEAGHGRCNQSNVFEVNVVAAAGLSGAISSIDTPAGGANALSGGAYLSAAVSTNAVQANGSSLSYARTWGGQTANAQWTGSYASNTTVSAVNFNPTSPVAD